MMTSDGTQRNGMEEILSSLIGKKNKKKKKAHAEANWRKHCEKKRESN
jgi:hypothetical protein